MFSESRPFRPFLHTLLLLLLTLALLLPMRIASAQSDTGGRHEPVERVAAGVLIQQTYLPLISSGSNVMAAADGTLYQCILEPAGDTK